MGRLTAAQRARNELAHACRRKDSTPEQITQARRDLAEINLTDAINAARELVATWPVFSDEKIAELTLLLRGESSGQGALDPA